MGTTAAKSIPPPSAARYMPLIQQKNAKKLEAVPEDTLPSVNSVITNTDDLPNIKVQRSPALMQSEPLN